MTDNILSQFLDLTSGDPRLYNIYRTRFTYTRKVMERLTKVKGYRERRSKVITLNHVEALIDQAFLAGIVAERTGYKED